MNYLCDIPLHTKFNLYYAYFESRIKIFAQVPMHRGILMCGQREVSTSAQGAKSMKCLCLPMADDVNRLATIHAWLHT